MVTTATSWIYVYQVTVILPTRANYATSKTFLFRFHTGSTSSRTQMTAKKFAVQVSSRTHTRTLAHAHTRFNLNPLLGLEDLFEQGDLTKLELKYYGEYWREWEGGGAVLGGTV
jgi:hypothetical protein